MRFGRKLQIALLLDLEVVAVGREAMELLQSNPAREATGASMEVAAARVVTSAVLARSWEAAAHRAFWC